MRARPLFGGVEAEDQGGAAEAGVGGGVGEGVETVHVVATAGGEVFGVFGRLGDIGQGAGYGLVSVAFGVLGSRPKGRILADAAAGEDAQ